MSKKVEDILHLFPGKHRRKDANSVYVVCPFHPDKNPSLLLSDSYSTGTHRLLTHCFGCDVSHDTILNFINSDDVGKLAKIAYASKKSSHSDDVTYTLTHTYSYNNEQGDLLYQILRYEPKKFGFRRPSTQEEYDNTGKKWVYEKKDSEVTLYNRELLHHLRTKSPDMYVWKVEGEGKCELLRKHKLVGVCNPFGATSGKWKPEFAEFLSDLNVVIVPDLDLTGYNHLYEVAESLLPVVKSLKVVQLPRINTLHGDIKDWFEDFNGSKEELLELLASAEELVGKDIEYVRVAYPYPENLINAETTSENATSIEDALMSDVDKFLADGVESIPKLYSDDMLEAMASSRLLLESEGRYAGLCDMCLGTGYLISLNSDGHQAAMAEAIVGDSETPEYRLKVCNHGVYTQNPEDFNF